MTPAAAGQSNGRRAALDALDAQRTRHSSKRGVVTAGLTLDAPEVKKGRLAKHVPLLM